MSSVRGSVNEVKSAVSKTNTELSGVVDDLNRSRRNNLLVKGMPDSDGENYVSTERKVRDFKNTNLNLKVNDIERAHRIGAYQTNFMRPIIIKFLNYKMKDQILRNASKLRDVLPKVWLEEDFSPKIQLERKKLRDFAKINRVNNERFTLRYNKLHIHGNYTYDAVSQSVKQIVAQGKRHDRKFSAQ